MRSRKPCSVHRGRTVWGRGRRGEPRLLLYSKVRLPSSFLPLHLPMMCVVLKEHGPVSLSGSYGPIPPFPIDFGSSIEISLGETA